MFPRIAVVVAACLIAGACSSIWDQQGEQAPSSGFESTEGAGQEVAVVTSPQGITPPIEPNATQESKPSEAPEAGTPGPQLGEVGHVAALGESDMSQFTPDYWASQEIYTVDVYLCAPPGRYEFEQSAPFAPMQGRGEEVREQTWGSRHDSLAGKVARFFSRESTGLLSLYFWPRLSWISLMTSSESEEWWERWEREGSPDPWRPRKPAGFSPPEMDWSSVTMETLYDDAASGRLSACEQAVAERQAAFTAEAEEQLAECERDPDKTGLGRCFGTRSRASLLLVDAPLAQVGGFAKFGGLAVVSLQSAGGRLDSDEFAYIVAHELGHSILHLQHTDEADGADCDDDKWALMRSNARCLSPPMGPDGLLGYEITCAERRLLNWRCEHELPDDEWFDGKERVLQSDVQALGELQDRADDLLAARKRGEPMGGWGGEWCPFLLESQGGLFGFAYSLARFLDVAEQWPDHPRVLRMLGMLGVDGVGELQQLLGDAQSALDAVDTELADQCWPR